MCWSSSHGPIEGDVFGIGMTASLPMEVTDRMTDATGSSLSCVNKQAMSKNCLLKVMTRLVEGVAVEGIIMNVYHTRGKADLRCSPIGLLYV